MRLDYTKAHSLPRLYEELVAGGITVEGLGDTSGTNDLWVQVPSTTTVATVDSIVAAHSSAVQASWDVANAAAVPTTLSYGDAPALTTPGRAAPLLHTHGAPSRPYYQNVIDNGDLGRWRRGTSFPGVVNGNRLADAWQWGQKNAGAVVTIAQSTTLPPIGANAINAVYSLKMSIPATADASIVAGDGYYIAATVYGYDYRVLSGGFTLSFWVQAHRTGTYCVAFQNVGGDRTYVVEYTVSAADTWEYKSVIIAAPPTAGTWNYTTGIGLSVIFTLAAGSSYYTTPNTWQTAAYLATSNQVNGVGATTDVFYLALVNAIPGAVSQPCVPQLWAISDPTTPITQVLGDVANPGTGPTPALSDHKHGMPTIALADLPTITQRTQVNGSTGGPTTTATSASPAALVDPVVTITTAGGDVLLEWSAIVSSSLAGTFVSVQIDMDATLVGIVHAVYCAATAGTYQATGRQLVTGVSAASHTFQLYWFVSGGATATANGTNRTIVAVEIRK